MIDMFIGPAMEGCFVKLQRDFYQKYGEHKELSQCVWEVMHTTFHITSANAIVISLLTGEEGEVVESNLFR